MTTPSKDILSRDTFLNLVRVHDRLNGEFSELFRASGLTQAQYNVLRILLGAPPGGTPCQYIGEHLLTRVPDVTRLIDRMVTAGLVKRERGEADRRVVFVRVTAKGKRLCNSLSKPVMDLHRKQFTHMTGKALQALHDGIQAALAQT